MACGAQPDGLSGCRTQTAASFGRIPQPYLRFDTDDYSLDPRLFFSQPTLQHLALGASLVISGLAPVGLSAHELSLDRTVRPVKDGSNEREARLAAA